MTKRSSSGKRSGSNKQSDKKKVNYKKEESKISKEYRKCVNKVGKSVWQKYKYTRPPTLKNLTMPFLKTTQNFSHSGKLNQNFNSTQFLPPFQNSHFNRFQQSGLNFNVSQPESQNATLKDKTMPNIDLEEELS